MGVSEGFLTSVIILAIVPLAIWIPVWFLKRFQTSDGSRQLHGDGQTDPPITKPAPGDSTPHDSTVDTVTCQQCGATNEALYTFCWNCIDPLPG